MEAGLQSANCTLGLRQFIIFYTQLEEKGCQFSVRTAYQIL